MSSKIGTILSMLFVVMFFLFGTDLLCLQYCYSSLDSKGITISYYISKNGRIDNDFISYLSNKYGILINEKQVFTHYEFDRKRQKPEGKVDIIYISYLPNLQVERIGGYLRNKIAWYKQKIQQGKYTLKKKGNYYEFISIN